MAMPNYDEESVLLEYVYENYRHDYESEFEKMIQNCFAKESAR